MGFKDARRAIIAALRAGRFQHEPRSLSVEKNLLAAGLVTIEDVITLLECCKGTQHQTSVHHFDATQTIHIFQPTRGGERWYLKAYLVKWEETIAVFISVHK